MNPPCVSVIIPTYNRMDTIGRAIDSVLQQTWKPIEIIVVDDGSTDRTLDVIGKYRGRIRLLCQENRGPSAARNAGIHASTGDIISFLDSDDAWLPEKTARQVRLLERTGTAAIGCCVCNARMFPAGGPAINSFTIADLHPGCAEGIWKNPMEILLTRFLLFNQTAAIRRDVLERTGGFRESLHVMEDYDLALRLAMNTSWAFIAEPLVEWHGGAANSLSNMVTEPEALSRTYEILAKLRCSEEGHPFSAEPLLHSRLRILNWHIRAYRLSSNSTPWMSKIGRVMVTCLRKYKQLLDHLPSAPRMVTVAA